MEQEGVEAMLSHCRNVQQQELLRKFSPEHLAYAAALWGRMKAFEPVLAEWKRFAQAPTSLGAAIAFATGIRIYDHNDYHKALHGGRYFGYSDALDDWNISRPEGSPVDLYVRAMLLYAHLHSDTKIPEPRLADFLPDVPPRRAVSPALRFQVFKRCGYRCQLCGVAAKDGEAVRLEIDHITARSQGGSDDLSNLWVLCVDCNRGKGTNAL